MQHSSYSALSERILLVHASSNFQITLGELFLKVRSNRSLVHFVYIIQLSCALNALFSVVSCNLYRALPKVPLRKIIHGTLLFCKYTIATVFLVENHIVGEKCLLVLVYLNLEKTLPRQLERSLQSSSDPGSVSSTEDHSR